MVVTKLSAELMLETPRPGVHITSPSSVFCLSLVNLSHTNSGTRFAQVCTTYDFKTKRTSRSVHVTDIPGDKESDVNSKAVLENLRLTELAWLDDDTLLYLRIKGDQAQVNIKLDDKAQKKIWTELEDESIEFVAFDTRTQREYVVGKCPTTDIGDLKVHVSSANEAILAFAATVYLPDKTVYKAKHRAQQLVDADDGADVKVYDKLMVRHWDSWSNHSSLRQIQLVRLSKKQQSSRSRQSSISSVEDLLSDDFVDLGESKPWSFASSIESPMASTDLECPVGPLGGSDDYAVCSTHLAFTAKDPTLNPALHTRQHIYLLPLQPRNHDEAKPQALTLDVGTTGHPVFSTECASDSADNGQLAWLEQRIDGYEADRNRVMLYDLATRQTRAVTEDWDRSASSITWSNDDKSLFLIAEEDARSKVFHLNLSSDAKPLPLTSDHTVSKVSPLPSAETSSAESTSGPRLLLTENSLSTPNVVKLMEDHTAHTLSDLAHNHLQNITFTKPEYFWFAGAYPTQDVQGIILRPPDYPTTKDSNLLALEEGKWPMVFLVHGGPQGAWNDGWSTRWNPAVWAAKGYIVVAINPTGSTGYGQAFCDAIGGEWGGLPYKDLVAGYQYVLKTYPEIDKDRTAAAGASYGGYMTNWLAGHNPGFKSLITHDGVFSTVSNYYGTEELWFGEREFNGSPHTKPAEYAKWNPALHVGSWSVPHLIIHGGRDYRIPDSEALAAFNVLQTRNIPSRLVYFPNENHWVLSAVNSRRWHAEVFKWLEEWIGQGRSSDQAHKNGYAVEYHRSTS